MVKSGMFISDRYEIIDKVGTGGTADVYKARCHRLNRFVAMKVLKAEYSDDKNFVAKFRAEAQSAAGLSHPNIVNVYDVGEDNGLYYIVMELIEGITLKTFIERKERLAVKEALAIAIQIAQGMEAAHENHIIHRDIKPQNIIISKDGKVKVTDFGIAKAATSNTITSNAMGSVHYLSPEQARGGYSDERSDIYSLGITLYEMLAGRVPYTGDNTVSVALLHIQGEAEPLHTIVPEIPISVEHIVEKCMQKKPEFRYQMAAELIRDLRKAITSPEEDFVQITGEEEISKSPTIQISDEERQSIKNSTRGRVVTVESEPKKEEEIPVEKKENVPAKEVNTIKNKENNPEEGNRNRQHKVLEQPEEEEELSEEDEIEPRLKKVMLIIGVATAVIFLIVLIVIIVRITGVFHKTTQEPNQQQEINNKINDNLDNNNPNLEDPDKEEIPTVPDVIGLDEEDATELLEERGYRVLVTETYSETVETGIVISQDPENDEELKAGKTVTITISLGEEPQESDNEANQEFSLDNLAGYTESEATSYIENHELIKQTTSKYSDSVSAGYVISTSPAADSMVKPGDTITLIISAGPESKMVEVPSLKDNTEADARAALVNAGLDIGEVSYVYSNSYEDGIVMAQDVKSGKEVKEGTKVGFTVSKGRKPEEQPEEPEEPIETTYYYCDYYIGVENSPLDDEEEGEITLVLTQDGKETVLYQQTITGNDFPLSNTIKSASDSAGRLNMLLDGADTGFQTSVTFHEEN